MRSSQPILVIVFFTHPTGSPQSLRRTWTTKGLGSHGSPQRGPARTLRSLHPGASWSPWLRRGERSVPPCRYWWTGRTPSRTWSSSSTNWNGSRPTTTAASTPSWPLTPLCSRCGRRAGSWRSRHWGSTSRPSSRTSTSPLVSVGCTAVEASLEIPL